MNKNMYLRCLLIVLASFCMHSYAEPTHINKLDLTAAKLNFECSRLLASKEEANFTQGLCVGIILGVEDNAHYDKKICVPNGIKMSDRLIVVKNYVQAQPKRMSEAYASLAFDALVEKWPCSTR